MDVVGVEVVGVEVVGVVPEVTVSKPEPVPVVPVPVPGVEPVPVVDPVPVDPTGFDLDELLPCLVTATARKPVPSASRTSASAMIRAPLPVARRGAFAVGAPHCRQ